jgi:protein transport protein SEC31
VKITTCATNPEIIKRSEQLVSAENEASKITELIEQRIEQHQGDDKEWRMLGTLFSENAREQLVCHLGFEKEQVMTEANRLLDTSLAEKEEADVPTGSPDAREDMFGIPSLSTLPLYSGDSDTDRFITRAIMVGDFEKAVDLCLELERYTDAILLGVCGGQNTLTRARNAYFASQSQPPYLPTLKNIMDNDLRRIVQTVALEEWASALVILCTFAQPKDFGSLCETLGNRLIDKDAALCCYLAAGNLIKVSNIWIEHLEKSKGTVDESTYHLQLQEFIEKMTLFRKAIDYEDTDGDGLTALYKKYCEYAEWMASQGKLQVALKYINLTPMKGNEKISVIRDRVFHACSKWSTRYKEPHFPFERETLVSNTIPQQLSPQTLHSRMENTSDPSNYYIPEYHTNNTQQQSIYSPTTTYKNYIPQPLYSTTAYMIPTNDVPSQEPREWNDPPIIADLNKPSLNQTLVKKTPFVNHQTPTTPPQHGDFTSPAPPSSSYYSARQQPTQLMATPPPPMNAVAPMLKRTQ